METNRPGPQSDSILTRLVPIQLRFKYGAPRARVLPGSPGPARRRYTKAETCTLYPRGSESHPQAMDQVYDTIESDIS